jgi:hypothetical protein
MNLGLLVEGHGEVAAVPLLIRRIAERLELPCVVRTVLREPRTTLIKPGELERAITLLTNKVGVDGGVLVLLDSDDDLPCALGPALLARAQRARPDRAIAVVLAEREYEAWFLAAAESLRGKRGLPDDLESPASFAALRDAKGWLHQRMTRGYSPTVDQPALTALFDLEQARRARSFDKLVREITRLLSFHQEPGR